MRILLGSLLLAVAIGAPILEYAPDPEASTVEAIEPTTVGYADRPLWVAKEILGGFLHRGFPYEAILDYFVQNLARAENNEETVARLHAWGQKWDIEWVKEFSYDAENKTMRYSGIGADDRRDGKFIIPQAEPPKHVSLTTEEYNAVAVKVEALIRRLLEQEGLPKEAVEEYINEGFHLLPMDIEKDYRLEDFCMKWGAPGYGRVVKLFVEMIVYGTANTDAKAAQPDAVTVETRESTTTALTDRPLYLAREILGQFLYRGVPYEAILDFFVQNIAGGGETEETLARMHDWGKKWDLEWVKTYIYDAERKVIYSTKGDTDARDSEGKPKVPRAKPAPRVSLTTEEYNTVAGKVEALIRRLLEQERLPEAAVEEYIKDGFHLLPMDLNKELRLEEFCEKWSVPYYADVLNSFVEVIVYGTANAEPKIDTVKVAESSPAPPQYPPLFVAEETLDIFFYRGVPFEAIVDYFNRKIDTSKENEETFARFQEWGRKWNIDWAMSMTYNADTNTVSSPDGDFDARDAEGKMILPQAEPAKHVSLTTEEHNAVAVKHEPLIRRLLRQQGLPEEAVEEYITSGFHLLPILPMDKGLRMAKFCEKWDVHNGPQVLVAFVETIIYGTANAEAAASNGSETTALS